jgi:Integrase core domain
MRFYDRLTQAVLRRPIELGQYTSIAFGLRCRQAGVQPSVGSVGAAYDNALCESFFATLECELLHRHRFATQAAARLAVFDYIEGWSQSAPASFCARLPVAHRLRAAGAGTSVSPKAVHPPRKRGNSNSYRTYLCDLGCPRNWGRITGSSQLL